MRSCGRGSMFMHLGVCAWGGQRSTSGAVPQKSFALLTRSFPGTWGWSVSHRDLFAPISPELALQAHAATPGFAHGCKSSYLHSKPFTNSYLPAPSRALPGDGPCTPLPLVPVLLRTPFGECASYNNHLIINLGLVIATTLEFLSHSC